jgi:uncharacterized protein
LTRSPFVVGVAELLRRPGTQRELDVVGPLPGLATTIAAVPDDADVDAHLMLESILDGAVTVTGSISAPWAGECRRCLRNVEGLLVTEVREVYAPPKSAPSEDDETYPLTGDLVDLEPLVRDAVLLALPLAPLCDDGCAGPDPDAHPVRVAGEGDDDAPLDPRWAALGELEL